MIEAHDKVAAKSYEMPPAPGSGRASLSGSLVPPDAVRMIGIQKRAGEPLVSLLTKPQHVMCGTMHWRLPLIFKWHAVWLGLVQEGGVNKGSIAPPPPPLEVINGVWKL